MAENRGSLYDSTTGNQIWNEQYDRPFAEVLAVQDTISEAIVHAMYPELLGFDRQRAMRRNPKDLTAWDLAQRGWWHWLRVTPADNAIARVSFGQALDRDPTFADAAAWLAETNYQNVAGGLIGKDSPDTSVAQVVHFAEQAVALDPQDAFSQHVLGHAYALTGNREGMIQAFKTSIELDPNSSVGQICAGEGLAIAGESDAAIEILNRNLRLSPKDPAMFWTYHAMALAYFGKKNYEESARWARLALAQNPQFAFGYRTLSASLALAGRLDEARASLVRATELEPDFTLGGGRRIMLAGNPQIADPYMSGLRLAGLK